jgi:acyl-CoA synthetase (AMP-forming)/AMP-acid ligase II
MCHKHSVYPGQRVWAGPYTRIDDRRAAGRKRLVLADKYARCMLHASRVPSAEFEARWASSLPSQTMDEVLSAAALARPNKAAVIDGQREVSFAQLDVMVGQCARWLQATDVSRGDAVAWQLPNCLESVVLFFATQRIGAVAVPIVSIYREREVGFICAETEAVVLAVPEVDERVNYRAQAQHVQDSVPTLRSVLPIALGSNDCWAAGEPLSATRERLAPRDVAVVVYTSGTEARPKGVMHSAATLLYDAESMRTLLDLTEDDVFFMPSPLAHITGLQNGVVTPITLGGSVVLQRRWDPSEALELIAKHHCTYSVLATPFLQQMFALPGASKAMASFRYVRCGGADIPDRLMAQAEASGVKVLRVYGLSELPTLTCTLPTSTTNQVRFTDGLPIGDVEVVIVDDGGTEVPIGQVGHILAAGPEMFLGYVDSSLNTGAFTSNGLFRTGDLGVFDEDGALQICGRAKDIIVRGGENLSALEIEEALRADPAVLDVAVVGVPDPVMGQRARAYMVASPGAHFDIERLKGLIERYGLAVQKTPEQLILVSELPRTASGKVNKALLRSARSGAVAPGGRSTAGPSH